MQRAAETQALPEGCLTAVFITQGSRCRWDDLVQSASGDVAHASARPGGRRPRSWAVKGVGEVNRALQVKEQRGQEGAVLRLGPGPGPLPGRQSQETNPAGARAEVRPVHRPCGGGVSWLWMLALRPPTRVRCHWASLSLAPPSVRHMSLFFHLLPAGVTLLRSSFPGGRAGSQ